jgi:signal transduction histidine kinase
MPSPVIGGRIAPVALLIALAFVIVGFFRADREMTHAEHDRAEITISETSTLVEAFVLRRLTELQSAVQAVDVNGQSSTWTADELASAIAERSAMQHHFDVVWLVDSAFHVQSSVPAIVPSDLTAIDTMALSELARQQDRRRDSNVLFGGQGNRRSLIFVVPLRHIAGARLLASAPIESLTVLLRDRQSGTTFDVLVATRLDTIVAIRTALPNKGVTRLTRSVELPNGEAWNISIAYMPSGRGVRIALWVVGFSAIVGLGIGLLLERREANRIADRSSELEHLSAELLRANRAKSEFLANVSHELRTPLNAIVGFVDLLRDGVYGPLNSRQAGPVERIEASANHLRHLVDQVLDLAKMAAGRLEVHTEPVELRPFVFDVASEVEPLMTEKSLSFSLAVGASLPRVRTDPTHLRQILVNLLGNAAKFTTNGGISIRGRLVRRGDQQDQLNGRLDSADPIAVFRKPDTLWIALQVVDSGIGIPEKDRERIFDEFEQVNAGPRGDSMRRGTGLGLSISRRLARLLGGDITVESELGRGSVFTVWLPVDPVDANRDRASG